METQAAQPLKKGWNQAQIDAWYEGVIAQGKRRDYKDVMTRLTHLPANTNVVEQYGLVKAGGDQYSLLCVTAGDLSNGNPNIIITGGVHGYEPSGVEAAVRFLEKDAPSLTRKFNFVVYPCISPWAYEYDQRWNAQARDPNREFLKEDNIEETRAFMTSVENRGVYYIRDIQLHETSDRDIELRQKRAERFGSDLDKNFRIIPQGYYLTMTQYEDPAENSRQMLLGRRIVEAVRAVSPIAPEAEILKKKNRDGIILSPADPGYLRTYMQGFGARSLVTEVYPDHPAMTFEKCVQAQLASIHASLNYIRH